MKRPASLAISPDFIRFGLVGTLGFCWDTGTVYALRHAVGLYAAGTAGFIIAASANWLLNRLWTFKHKTHGPAHRQWAKFLAANLLGFALNRGTFFTLISISRLFHDQPILAIMAGTLAGLTANYFLSKKFVFT